MIDGGGPPYQATVAVTQLTKRIRELEKALRVCLEVLGHVKKGEPVPLAIINDLCDRGGKVLEGDKG